MAATARPFDRIIFGSTIVLAVGGFLIFMSASLGLIASGGGAFSGTAAGQLMLGVAGGFVSLFVTSFIPYRLWRRFALAIFIVALLLTLAVFIPHLGVAVNGARRWLNLGITTFQPSELLKVAYVLFLGACLSVKRTKPPGIVAELGPFMIITALAGAVLLIQPDTDSFLVLLMAGGAMLLASGARLRDIALLILLAVVGFGILVALRPYLLERMLTFVDPGRDPRGAGYQIQQSLLAVGSGEAFGRGFGQSIQKFNYLPEPTSDSIFAVYAEEFGFAGSCVLIVAFLTFALRGLWVAVRVPDRYGGLVAIGVVILIIGAAFVNIASMLGVFPFSGLPLPFVSHGGSALAITLASVGILLNVSRARRIG
jgi:cell division protein FtsW